MPHERTTADIACDRPATFIRVLKPLTLAGKRSCRSCGANVPNGTKFCFACRQPLSARPR